MEGGLDNVALLGIGTPPGNTIYFLIENCKGFLSRKFIKMASENRIPE